MNKNASMRSVTNMSTRSLKEVGHRETHDILSYTSLSIVVVGASGDLAKKKTYPSLFALFKDDLLPIDTKIWGYARSAISDADFRDRIRPYLLKGNNESEVNSFLEICSYHSGPSYGDIESFTKLSKSINEYETELEDDLCEDLKAKNRLFYFAIPPNVFADTAVAIKQTCMTSGDSNWTRLIIEKPFGRDSESFEKLNATLSQHFTEDHLYRIDHYLGKEMVQNLLVLRFANPWFEQCWSGDHIQCVILTFKEPFGTDGRGGYFDKYGIIRDILQNHLLQVLTLLCMEAPSVLEGPGSGKAIRDAKVAVLDAMEPIRLDDCVLGQYENYADDPTITNKDTNCPTYCCMRVRINTPRWKNVPIFLKAGKALNEKKGEMRIQFKDSSYSKSFTNCPRNELVMRLQPNEAVYMKTNIKKPGFTAQPIQSELEINYDTRFFQDNNSGRNVNPDAYTRLIFDVICGKHAAFVRDDELRRAWEIFTPVLHRIENENVKPIVYKQQSRGPTEADTFVSQYYQRNLKYRYNAPVQKQQQQQAPPSSSDSGNNDQRKASRIAELEEKNAKLLEMIKQKEKELAKL